jgi:hypothetical protein
VVNQIRNNGVAYAVKPNGTTVYADTFSPGVLQPFTATVDSAGDFFVGGYEINKITPAGVQTQVNTVGAIDGLAVDAADTLYATRYSPTDGVAELAKSDYSTPIASFGRSSPLGLSLGSDGTLYVSNYVNLDIFDRSMETIDFGEVDATKSQTSPAASVYNGGNEPLTISEFTLSGEGFSLDLNATNECAVGTVLAPGALCQASVVFTPGHPGTFSGTIAVTSNSLNDTSMAQTIQLTGITYGSYDVLSPNPLAFASQAPGSSKAQAVTLTNEGNFYASTVYSVATDNPAFTITEGTCSGVAVPVGSGCQLQVTFSPIAAQSYTGNATVITYVSGSGQPFQTITLPLSGSGIGPLAATPIITPGTGTYTSSQQVTITDSTSNSTIYYTIDGSIPTTGSTKYTGALTVNTLKTVNALATAAGYTQSSVASATFTFKEPVAVVTPTSLAFGNQIQSIPRAAQTVTLKNTGVDTLTITGFPITGSADFSQTNNCGGSLAAGSSCTLSIVFTPTSLSDKTATLSVNSDSIQAAPTVTLTGSGIAAPVAMLTPASLNFAPQQQGSASAAMTLTLSNPSSTTALNFDSISISGAGSASFGQTNNCGAAIAANGKCSLSVIFTPANVGALSATLAVVTRYPGFGPVSISSALSGTGTAPPAPTFTPSTLAFGNQVVTTTSAQLTTALTNTGTDTLVIDGALPAILGAGAASISATSNCPATLAPAATCNVSASFTPSSVQDYALSLQMTAHYSGAPSIKFKPTVALTGTGIPPPAVLTLAPTKLDFGNQIVNLYSGIKSVTVTNSSTTDKVIVSAITTSGSGFLPQPSSCTSPIAPGASCTIPFIFFPGAVQAYSTTVTLQVQASGCGGCVRGYPNQTFTVTGVGIAAPPVLTFSPATLDFGNQSVGLPSGARSVTVTNSSKTDTVVIGSIEDPTVDPFLIQPTTCFVPIAPGASCTLSYIFNPGAVQSYSSGLIFRAYSNACGVACSYPNQTFTITGAGIADPVPTLVPSSLNFGNQTVGSSSAPKTITLTNPANIPLTVDSIGLSTFSNAQTTNNCGNTIAPGQSCQISVTFVPTIAAPLPSALSIGYHYGTLAPTYASVQISGTGVLPPSPTVTPASLNFGDQIVGTASAPKTVTITNPAIVPVTVDAIGLSTFSNAQTTNNCGGTIAAGASCQVSVTFVPTLPAPLPSMLSIQCHFDTLVPLILSVQILGTGIAPSQPTFSPASLTFAPQGVATTSESQTVTVTNPAGADQPITVEPFTFAGGTHSFTQTNNCPASLAAGADCQVEVSFVPGSAGAISDKLELNYLGEGGLANAAFVSLNGTGIAPSASLSPASLNFSSTLGTTSAPQTATLTNTGTTPLVVLNISFTGANPDVYQQSNDCATVLFAGASCTISVTFAPAFPGSYPATLSVSDDGPLSPQTISLTGSATTTPDFVVASSTPPQSIPLGGSAEFSLTVTAQNGAMIPVVTLTATGLPPGATATFSQSTVTPGSTSATSTLTIKTAASPMAAGGSEWPAAVPTLALVGWLFIPNKRRRRLATLGVLLFTALGSLTFLGGCGAHFAGYSTVPSQTYTVTITATIGKVQQSTTVNLTIN